MTGGVADRSGARGAPRARPSRQAAAEVRQQIEELYRAESRAVFATLVRRLRDFDLAEEVLQEAFISALDKWPR